VDARRMNRASIFVLMILATLDAAICVDLCSNCLGLHECYGMLSFLSNFERLGSFLTKLRHLSFTFTLSRYDLI